MKRNKKHIFEAWKIKQHGRFSQAVMLGTAACIGLGSKVHAEDAPAVPAATLPEVVVTGQQGTYKPERSASPKYTAPLREIPQTVTVVPQKAIEEQGATTLREVLRNVPGISIQAGEGGVPAGDNLSIRGFNARTDIFIDGVRDFGGYSRDIFNIEQVEVTKGPTSSYAGRGSTGGAINMIGKYPGLNKFANATLGVGSDEFQRATIDINQPIAGKEGTSLRMNALWHSQAVADRNAVDAARWGIAPSVGFGLNSPTRINVGYFHLSQDNMPDYGIPWVPGTNNILTGDRNAPAPVDYKNFYGLRARDYEKTTTDIGTVIAEHDVNEKVNLRSILRYGRTERDSVITAPRFASDNTTVINRQLQSRDQVDSIFANQTDIKIDFETGKVAHKVVTGVEYSKEGSENFSRSAPTAPLADLYNPNPDDVFNGSVTRTGASADADATSTALYAFDTLKLTDQWDLTGGLRWDSFSVDYLSVSTPTIKTPFSRTDDMLSWRAGAVYKPAEIGSVYAAAGTSFNPSAEGLTLANTATALNNVNTDPEESRSVELGTKWDILNKRLALNFALFRTEKINARTEDPANPADIVVLQGRQRVDGFEIGAAGSLSDVWAVFAGYTYMDSKVLSSNNPAEIGRELANTPRHSASLWTTYELPANFDVGAGVQFVDERYNSTTTPRLAPSYVTTDAMLAYHINQNFTLRLNGYNLADEEYIDRVGGGHFVPGAGRSATLTTEVKF